MNKNTSIATLAAGLFAAAALLAGCGAGGYGGASSTMYRPPTPSPAPTQSGAPLATASLNGAAGFVNAGNFTVYVFDADLASPGQSNCNGACSQNWPPVAAPAGTLPAPWSSIVRQDGTSQLTYKGRPMYTFIADSRPGQTNGDGLDAFGGLWHIARP